jgi:hypothetical protein
MKYILSNSSELSFHIKFSPHRVNAVFSYNSKRDEVISLLTTADPEERDKNGIDEF